VTHHAAAERRELTATLRRSAPDGPTLCPPWSVAELAAHLVLRGRSVRYGWAQARGAEERALAMQQELVRTLGYPAVVDAVASIRRASPLRAPGLDDAVNLIEYVVHHEDVRRARPDWSPRALPADRQDALWRMLRLSARTAFRRTTAALSLDWAGSGRPPISGSHPRATVHGDPVELTLVVLGRSRVAQVQVDGDREVLS